MSYKPHRHLIIGASCHTVFIDPETTKQYLADIITGIGMKIMPLGAGQGNPFAAYCIDEGNEGLTAGGILTTSHVMMHFWENPKRIEFDLYSCSKFDPAVIFQKLNKDLGLIKGYIKFIDRDEGHTIIDCTFEPDTESENPTHGG